MWVPHPSRPLRKAGCAVSLQCRRNNRRRFDPLSHGPAKMPALLFPGGSRREPWSGPQPAAVPKKSNIGDSCLLKRPTVPIRVTDSSAPMRARSGDHGDNPGEPKHGHTYAGSVAAIRKHDRAAEQAAPGVSWRSGAGRVPDGDRAVGPAQRTGGAGYGQETQARDRGRRGGDHPPSHGQRQVQG